MGKVFVDGTKKAKNIDGGKRAKIFAVKKTAKLGTEKNPAVVRVQTEEKMKEAAALFEENNWKYTIELDPDQPEDITDLERLLTPLKPVIAGKKLGRQ